MLKISQTFLDTRKTPRDPDGAEYALWQALVKSRDALMLGAGAFETAIKESEELLSQREELFREKSSLIIEPEILMSEKKSLKKDTKQLVREKQDLSASYLLVRRDEQLNQEQLSLVGQQLSEKSDDLQIFLKKIRNINSALLEHREDGEKLRVNKEEVTENQQAISELAQERTVANTSLYSGLFNFATFAEQYKDLEPFQNNSLSFKDFRGYLYHEFNVSPDLGSKVALCRDLAQLIDCLLNKTEFDERNNRLIGCVLEYAQNRKEKSALAFSKLYRTVQDNAKHVYVTLKKQQLSDAIKTEKSKLDQAEKSQAKARKTRIEEINGTIEKLQNRQRLLRQVSSVWKYEKSGSQYMLALDSAAMDTYFIDKVSLLAKGKAQDKKMESMMAEESSLLPKTAVDRRDLHNGLSGLVKKIEILNTYSSIKLDASSGLSHHAKAVVDLKKDMALLTLCNQAAQDMFFSALKQSAELMKRRVQSYVKELESHPLYLKDPKDINDSEDIKSLLFLMANIHSVLKDMDNFKKNTDLIGDKMLTENVSMCFGNMLEAVGSKKAVETLFEKYNLIVALYRHMGAKTHGWSNQVWQQFSQLNQLVEENNPFLTLITQKNLPTRNWVAGVDRDGPLCSLFKSRDNEFGVKTAQGLLTVDYLHKSAENRKTLLEELKKELADQNESSVQWLKRTKNAKHKQGK